MSATSTDGTTEGIDFLRLGQVLQMPPLAAVCAAVAFGYPLVNDRFPSHLLGALAQRCGVRIASAPATDAPSSLMGEGDPARDPQQRRRILRIVLQRMVRRGTWLPAAADNHSIVRSLPANERGLGHQAIEVLVRAGWLRASKPSGDPALGMLDDARPAIEAAVKEARIDDPVILEWLNPQA